MFKILLKKDKVWSEYTESEIQYKEVTTTIDGEEVTSKVPNGKIEKVWTCNTETDLSDKVNSLLSDYLAKNMMPVECYTVNVNGTLSK